jgi:hypothetical protein
VRWKGFYRNFKSPALDIKQQYDANFATGSLAEDARSHKKVTQEQMWCPVLVLAMVINKGDIMPLHIFTMGLKDHLKTRKEAVKSSVVG